MFYTVFSFLVIIAFYAYFRVITDAVNKDVYRAGAQNALLAFWYIVFRFIASLAFIRYGMNVYFCFTLFRSVPSTIIIVTCCGSTLLLG